MEKQKTIGYAHKGSHPYEIAIYWENVPSSPPRTIALSEGSGHANMAGCFFLSEMLHEAWTENLEVCDCLWLRDLAVEEKARGQLFSADEIYAIWEERAKKKK